MSVEEAIQELRDQVEADDMMVAQLVSCGLPRSESTEYRAEAFRLILTAYAAQAAEIKALRKLVKGLEGLNAAYRVGRQRAPERSLDMIHDARAELEKLAALSGTETTAP